nr:mitochondrial-processing peptidase subunit alpha-like [Tanacetum cinerariifolium]
GCVVDSTLSRFASSSAVTAKSSSGGLFSIFTGGSGSSSHPLDFPLMGGNVTASASREQMGYTYDALKTYVPQMVELLVDCVRNQAFKDWEVNE